MNNRFERNILAKRKLAEDLILINKNRTNYLLDCSLDYLGSPLKQLLDNNEIQVCREFIDLMAKANYLESKKIKLECKTKLSVLGIVEQRVGSWHYKKRTKLFNSFRWRRLWVGLGYPIGVIVNLDDSLIREHSSSSVYLCSDLKLRCARSYPVFGNEQSFTYGVGTIPAKLSARHKFIIGKFVKTYDETEPAIFETEQLEKMLTDLSETLLLSAQVVAN